MYNYYFYDGLSRKLDIIRKETLPTTNKIPYFYFDDIPRPLSEVEKVNYPDIAGIAQSFSNLGKINYPDVAGIAQSFSNLGKINYPDVAGIAQSFSNLGKINYPDVAGIAQSFSNLGKINYPDVAGIAQSFSNLGKINYSDVTEISQSLAILGKLSASDFNKIVSISETFSSYPDKLLDIDWGNFDTSEEDLKEATSILSSKDTKKHITKELNNENSIKGSIKAIAKYIYIVVSFLSGLVAIAEYTEEKIIPVTQTFYHYIEKDIFNSDREAINWLNDGLKEDTKQQLSKNFRIVTKNNLIVREGKTINSKVKGQLNLGDVVQIIEKKKNWTYIHFSNYEDSEIVEGWVFTRYLKQIK